ncbi:Ig-like domain repeat protein [Methanobrevibacter arboriphilus]|uniref:beta strand repeat-containing protein n=1 Tax=Methanobrevibacter arboriphilus TaxID=39441 RepID=UPI00241CACC2|nr:Ig-like domain repeat protein [Methanobrevibacter arboriphilus]
MTVSNGNFSGNNASYGGVIYSNSAVTVSNGNFSGNNAIYGGVIFNNGTNMTVSNGNFSGNNATIGGAIYSSGYLNVKNSIFSDNLVVNDDVNAMSAGGAIWNNGSNLTITNSQFIGNRVNLDGTAINNNLAGAVYNEGDNLNITLSIFTNNIVNNYSSNGNTGGGAIRNIGNNSIITDCKFNNNSVANGYNNLRYGGAIWNSGNMTIINSNFTNNTITNGSGLIIYSDGNIRIYNSNFSNKGIVKSGEYVNIKGSNANGSSLINCSFESDYSSNNINAIFFGSSYFTVDGCNFTGLTNDHGSAIMIYEMAVTNITVINSNFWNNIAGHSAIVYNWAGMDNVSVINCSFINNTAGGAGPDGIITSLGGHYFYLANSTFINNSGGVKGLGLTISGSDVNITIEGCVFIDNNRWDASSNIHISSTSYTLTLINSSFTNNSRAIFFDFVTDDPNINFSGNSYISGCNFTNNTQNYGSVFYNNLRGYSNNTFNMTVVDSNFIDNGNNGIYGGILYNNNYNITLNLYLLNNNFTDNTADNGGIIYNNNPYPTDSYYFQDNTFSYNNVSKGGIIYNNGYLILNNTTIENGLAEFGGGIYNKGNLSIDNSTFRYNNADYGGGVFNEGSVNVTNSYFHDNLQGLATNNKNFLLLYNNFTDNYIAIQFYSVGDYWNRPTFIIDDFNETNIIESNSYAVGISGYYSNFIIKGYYHSDYSQNGIIFYNSNNNQIIDSNISNYTNIALTFHYTSNYDSLINSNITDSSNAVYIYGDFSTLTNLKFNNNRYDIYSYSGSRLNVNYCNFTNNTYYSMYIYYNTNYTSTYYNKVADTYIDGCNFINNKGIYGIYIIGVYNNVSTIQINRCNFSDNYYSSYAVYVYYNFYFNLQNSNFTNNNISQLIYLNYNNYSTNINNVNVINNTASSSNLFYIYMNYNYIGDFNVNYCNFTNNTAASSILYLYGGSQSIANVNYCNFTNNTARNNVIFYYSVFNGYLRGSSIKNSIGSNGQGTIYYSGSYNLIVSGSNIANNTGYSAGGVYYSGGGNFSLSNSNITNNTGNGTGTVGGGLFFSYVNNITIINSNIANNTGATAGAIYYSSMSDIKFLTISNSNINGNKGHYGAIYYSSNINISDSNITNNAGNITGAIYYYGPYNITINNTNIANNTGMYGGALFIHNLNSYGFIVINNSKFVNNSGDYGGAIYKNQTYSYGIDNFIIDTSVFVNNIADQGGAIYNNNTGNSSNNGNLTLINSNFTGNTANLGGAIYNKASARLGLNGSSFNNNYAVSGGAIYNEGEFNLTNSNFTNNNATNGGAVYNDNGDFLGDFLLNNIIFTRNSANLGGVIYNKASARLGLNGSSFNNNYAVSGGAIYNEGEFNLTNSNFTNNNATNGGVIYNSKADYSDSIININNTLFTRNTGVNGGVVYNVEDALININNSNFTRNTASSNGGVIYNQGKLTINQSNLNRSEAINGSVVYNDKYSSALINNSNISSNTATNSGGVVYNTGDDLIIDNSNIFSNTATNSGAAIYNTGDNLLINNSNINDHESNTDGGAIINTGDDFTISNSNITDNSAKNDGGAINNTGRDFTIVNSTFTENSAENDGGAIINTGRDFTIVNSTFTENSAENDGGAIINTVRDFTINNSTFTLNKANNGGAIYHGTGILSLSESSFDSNTANYGGGIFNNAEINITKTNFTTNTANFGAAIYNNKTMNINESNFINHTIIHTDYDIQGGAVLNNNTISVIDSNFTGNTYGFQTTTKNFNFKNNNLTNNDLAIQFLLVNGGTVLVQGLNDDNWIESNNYSIGICGNYTTYTFIDTNSVENTNGFIFTGRGNTITNSNITGYTGWGVTFNTQSQDNTITMSTLSDNHGAIYNNGNNNKVSYSNFINNNGGVVPNPDLSGLNIGGGVFNDIYGVFNVTQSSFNGNNASIGGGIYNLGILNVELSNFINNNASTGYGSGIYHNGININLVNSTFSNNGEAFTTTKTTGFTLTNNNFNENNIAIQFVFNNLAYTVNSLTSNSNSFNNNNFILGISGNKTNYVILDTFNNTDNTKINGVIFTENTFNNSIINSIITGYNGQSSIGVASIGVAIYGVNNSIINSNITDNNIGVLIKGNTTNIKGSNIINNKQGIVIGSEAHDTLINYNRLVNTLSLIDNGTNTNANYNWWGKNNITNQYQNNTGTLAIDNWYVINLTANNISAIFSDGNISVYGKGHMTLNYIFQLIDGGLGDINSLPDFDISFLIYLNDYVNNNTAIVNITNSSRKFNGTYEEDVENLPQAYTMSAKVDNQESYYKIQYNKIDLIITVEDIIAIYGEDIKLNITITDNNTTPSPIPDGYYIIMINGTEYNLLFTNGNGTINLGKLPAGDYKLNITFKNTDLYAETNTTVNITVNKAEINLNVNSTNTTYKHNDSILIINATNNNISTGPSPVDDGNYTIIIKYNSTHSETYKVEFINGIGIINLGKISANNYSLNITFNETLNYNESNTIVNFTVFKDNPTLNITANNPTVLDDLIITINSTVMISDDNRHIDDGYYNVTVNGTTYNNVKFTNGTATLNLANQSAGTYTWNITLKESTNYNESSSLVSFVVRSITNSSILVVPSWGSVGYNLVVSGLVSDENGNPLNNVDVTIIIGSNTYHRTTNVSGLWVLGYSVPGSIVPGTDILVNVSWAGNGSYYGFNNSTYFLVLITTNSSVIVPNNPVSGEPVLISGKVVDYTGGVVKDVNITLKINNEVVIVSTDAYGDWSYNFTPTIAGEYNVTVTWNGTDHYYSGFTNTTSFTVRNITNSSIIVDGSFNVGLELNISGVLTDKAGNVLSGVNLTVSINGTSYALTTGGDGKWNVTYTPSSTGLVNVVVSWNGNETYFNFINATNFTVSKSRPVLNASVTDVTYGMESTLTVNATLINGNPIDNGTYVVIVNGVQYSVYFTDGIGSMRLGELGAGVYKWDVTFVDTRDKYDMSNTTVSFKVSSVAPVVSVNNLGNRVYGEIIIITGTVTGVGSVPTGTVTIHFNNGENTTPIRLDSNGYWSYTFNTTEKYTFTDGAGSYVVNVTYSGDSNYTSMFNDTISFNIFKASPVLIVNPVSDIVYGNNITVMGNVTGVGSVPTGNVTIHFNDGNSVIVDLDNTGYWSYTFNTTNSSVFVNGAGSYTVNVTYNGNNNYTNITNDNRVKFVITPTLPILIVNPVDDVIYGNNVTINGTVTGVGSVPTGTVTIHFNNGGNVTVNLKMDGSWSYTFNTTNFSVFADGVGSYVVNVTYNGDNNYTGAVNVGVKFNILSAAPVVIVNSVSDVVYGDNVTVAGIVVGVGVIPTGNVTIHFNNGGSNVTVKLETNGTWSYTFNTTNNSFFTDGVGSYVVNVTYNSDNNYTHAFNDTISFNITQATPVVIIDSVSDVVYGNNVTVTGNVTGVGSVPTGNVTIHFNNGGSVTVNLKTDGSWSYTFNTTNFSVFTDGVGSYTVNVTYNGDSNYTRAFNDKLSFNITPAHPVVIVDAVNNVVYGDNVTVAGIVVGVGVIPTGNVTIHFNNGSSVTVNLKTDGSWSYTFYTHNNIFNGAGSYVVNVTYNGDKNYNNGLNDTISFNILAVSVNSTIVIPSNVKVGKSITISGVLSDVYNNTLANASVLVTIDGKTYKVTTDNNGVWKLSYTPKKEGKFNIKVSYLGNSDYIGFDVSKSFKAIGEAKISIVKITKLVKVGKYKGFNLYSKTYTLKNLGTGVGSKDYVKYFKNWYLEKLSKTSKAIKYQWESKSRVLKVQVKNLGVGKQAKIKILVTRRKRL